MLDTYCGNCGTKFKAGHAFCPECRSKNEIFPKENAFETTNP